MKKENPERPVTIDQLYELLPHMQAGRITRADIQKLIETAARRELQVMRDDCIEKAYAAIKGIDIPSHVQEQIARNESISGQNHYVEAAIYKQVRILTSLYAVTRENRYLDQARHSVDSVRQHIHPYEEAMIRLRIAEVTESVDDYKVIVELAQRGPEGFAKRVTILCDLALISGKVEYLDLAKAERGKLTGKSGHTVEADGAIEYLEHRKSCSEPSKIVLARDDFLFPKFTSYLLQSSEACGEIDWVKTMELICTKRSIELDYAQCLQEYHDEIDRKIILFRIAIAHIIRGDCRLAHDILIGHGFDRRYLERAENIYAKATSKNRRLTTPFKAALSIKDPYLMADALLAIAREIDIRLKK